MFRSGSAGLEVFLVHPGGPYYVSKNDGVWSVPKGEIDDATPPFEVACREFEEETGQPMTRCATSTVVVDLGAVVLPSGKSVQVWAFAGDWPAGAVLRSNTFELEWPPRSGRRRQVPEVDRGEFFTLADARRRIHPGQAPLLDRLVERVALATTQPAAAAPSGVDHT
jgi:predicted NUDIX family NTP pyrophosphohydrolase